MTVNKDGPGLGVDYLASKHDRMTKRFANARFVSTGLDQQVSDCFCAKVHISLVFGLSADRLNPENGKQFFQKTGLVLLYVGLH